MIMPRVFSNIYLSILSWIRIHPGTGRTIFLLIIEILLKRKPATNGIEGKLHISKRLPHKALQLVTCNLQHEELVQSSYLNFGLLVHLQQIVPFLDQVPFAVFLEFADVFSELNAHEDWKAVLHIAFNDEML